jgi:Raf kinase inhibitor-like YbhB/YbcL family protein
MELRSSAFFIGNSIPFKYTCDGDNISPPLQWEDPPNETQSFALILEDPDAPHPDFTHWVLFNIPANCRELPEAIEGEETLPEGSVEGKNDFGQFGFAGPCPPEGTHRYFFKLFALDQLLDLEAGASKQEALQAMENHVLDKAELMGRYTRS